MLIALFHIHSTEQSRARVHKQEQTHTCRHVCEDTDAETKYSFGVSPIEARAMAKIVNTTLTIKAGSVCLHPVLIQTAVEGCLFSGGRREALHHYWETAA